MGRNWTIMDLTLLTCNYNTPELIVNLLKSVKQTCSELPYVVVMNTSTEDSDILDNNNIHYFNVRGFSHGEAVNLAFSKIKTKYILLVDSDVIFLKDFKNAFNKFKEMDLALMGKIVGDCGDKKLYPRIEPWYCFINLEKLKLYRIQFFDRERSKKQDKEVIYDIGSTMFEDVTNLNLSIGDVNLENKYFKHYGGMSWREQKYNPNDIDTDIDFGGTHPHKFLYDLAQNIKSQYLKDTQYLNNITL